MFDIPEKVELVIDRADGVREQGVFSLMEMVRKQLAKLDVSDDEKSHIAGCILLAIEQHTDSVYFGGIAVGLASHEYGFDPTQLVPKELLERPENKPVLTLIRGGKDQ